MATWVYCDRVDCVHQDPKEGMCSRSGIKLEADVSYSGVYCSSVVIKSKKQAKAGNTK